MMPMPMVDGDGQFAGVPEEIRNNFFFRVRTNQLLEVKQALASGER